MTNQQTQPSCPSCHSDPGVAARAQLSAQERQTLDAELQSCMSRRGQRGLGELLDRGAGVDSKYPRGGSQSLASPIWGMTVSMLAAQKLGIPSQNAEAFPAMERVLRLCDPHATDREGMTPLMHAACEGSLGVEALAPRSNLLAVCGDLGENFDGGWPALFFVVNTRASPQGLARQKELCALLAPPDIWTLRSREGRDVFACAERLGPAPDIIAFLHHLQSMHAAEAQALEISSATPGPHSLRAPKPSL